jgi:complex iron-sulfur molybdoenzyme family reductase subunit gamma
MICCQQPIFALSQQSVSNYSMSEDIIKAQFERDGQVKLNSSIWINLPGSDIKIFAQKTIRLNDKTANEKLVRPSNNTIIESIADSVVGTVADSIAKPTANVKAIYNDTLLSVKVEWKDSTQSLISRKETNSFGDAVALELPKDFSKRLPYIGMGDEKQNVYVYLQRAAEEAHLINEYIAAGFGSLTRLSKGASQMQLSYDNQTKKWQALFQLPLTKRNMKQALLPMAFAFWDGANNERGGNKFLSGWKFIEMANQPKNSEYQKKLSADYFELPSAEKGRQIFNSVCITCHRAGSIGKIPVALAPDLENVGAIASPGYLRDSITEPSQVVVRNLNINRHYNKALGVDANGAYVNNENYKWYSLNSKGERISKMPSFKGLPDEDIKSLVAYIKGGFL